MVSQEKTPSLRIVNMNDKDKNKALKTALDQIEKCLWKRFYNEIG